MCILYTFIIWCIYIEDYWQCCYIRRAPGGHQATVVLYIMWGGSLAIFLSSASVA